MHHPPLLTGIAGMDEIGLETPTRWPSSPPSSSRAPNVLRVVAGHVHRAMYSTPAAARPVFSCPSTDVAIALDLRAGAELGVLDEPPAFALHLVTDGSRDHHVQPAA